MLYLRIIILLQFLPFLLPAQASTSPSENAVVSVIPQPASSVSEIGEDFRFTTNTQMVARTAGQKQAAGVFTDLLREGSGLKLKVSQSAPNKDFVLLEKDRSLPAEHYQLNVNANRISITASSAAGWTYGLQTIRQLLPPGIEDKSSPITNWRVPALTITDGPEFISKVYSFNPRQGIDNEKQASHVLGGQGNLWSEYVTTTSHSEYMIFPRLAALSEALWTSAKAKSWPNFSANVPTFFQRLDALGVNYARSAYAVTPAAEASSTGEGIELSLASEFPVSFPASTARYLRVKVTNLGKGPLGGGSWMFLDDIIVR